VFAQQSLQPKLSRRRYASVSYALQNSTVFKRTQNWVSDSDGSRILNGRVPQHWSRDSKTSLAVISLFWNVVLLGHSMQQNWNDHDWLIQTPVSTDGWTWRSLKVIVMALFDRPYITSAVYRLRREPQPVRFHYAFSPFPVYARSLIIAELTVAGDSWSSIKNTLWLHALRWSIQCTGRRCLLEIANQYQTDWLRFSQLQASINSASVQPQRGYNCINFTRSHWVKMSKDCNRNVRAAWAEHRLLDDTVSLPATSRCDNHNHKHNPNLSKRNHFIYDP